MKTTRNEILGAVALFIASAISTFAVEGLQISAQSSNSVLSWPSVSNETYLIQYRPTLGVGSSWLTLVDDFPAFINTNRTTFSRVRSNNAGFYRVVQDGVQVFGLTNGVILSGTVQFPIEIASTNYGDEIVGINFYDANSNPIIGAYAQSLGGNVWQMVWNTTLSFNSNYTVYAELDFASNNPVVSSPVTVTVSNVISFPNFFSQTFGSQMWIYAQTITNAAYQLDMYDENSNYIGSFTGTADSNGIISFTWNLTDGIGNTYDDTNFYGVFTVNTSSLSNSIQGALVENSNTAPPHFQTVSPLSKALITKIRSNGISPNGSSASPNAKNFWVKESAWSPNNNWVVAYGLFSSSSAIQAADLNMIEGGTSGEFGGVFGTLDPYGLNNNLSPGNDPNRPSVFTVQDTNTTAALLNYLSDYRYENFYFFGHGNSSAIGSYIPGINVTQG